jgi:hemerythrin superfamily protein
MNRLIERIAPSATQLVRRDHTLVLETFHRYRASASPAVRQALAQSICLALEVHTRIEEELLYPAVRAASESDFLRRAVPEHEQMRRLIEQLRRMSPSDPDYDATFLTLMRDVMHHMADEETDFLPQAERVLRGRLGELGAQMMRRRVALMAPRGADLAFNRVRAAPGRALLLVAGLVLGGLMMGRRRAGARQA